MLSKRTLELAIEQMESAIYKHSQIPHDPLYKDLIFAYGELRIELTGFKADEASRIIVETETKDMNE
jgi:hypothetical protein